MSELVRNLKQMALKKRDEVSERTGKQPDLRGIMEWRAAIEIERLTAEVKSLKDTRLQVCPHLFISGCPEGMNRVYCASCDNEYMIPSKAFASGGPATIACEWFEDDDGWHSGCGQWWEFTYDGPKENGVSFCMYCSKPVAIAELVSGRHKSGGADAT